MEDNAIVPVADVACKLLIIVVAIEPLKVPSTYAPPFKVCVGYGLPEPVSGPVSNKSADALRAMNMGKQKKNKETPSINLFITKFSKS